MNRRARDFSCDFNAMSILDLGKSIVVALALYWERKVDDEQKKVVSTKIGTTKK